MNLVARLKEIFNITEMIEFRRARRIVGKYESLPDYISVNGIHYLNPKKAFLSQKVIDSYALLAVRHFRSNRRTIPEERRRTQPPYS